MKVDVATVSLVGASVSALATIVTAIVAYQTVRSERQLRGEQLKHELSALARIYETVRAAAPSGADRTRAMELIADQLRTIAAASDVPISDFVRSELPGDRLAAAVALQVHPRVKYLEWLAERLYEEKPFLAYHAALALQAAAHALSGGEREKAWRAVMRARLAVADNPDTDRWSVLNEALHQLP